MSHMHDSMLMEHLSMHMSVLMQHLSMHTSVLMLQLSLNLPHVCRKKVLFRCSTVADRSSWLHTIDTNRIALNKKPLGPRHRLEGH